MTRSHGNKIEPSFNGMYFNPRFTRNNVKYTERNMQWTQQPCHWYSQFDEYL